MSNGLCLAVGSVLESRLAGAARPLACAPRMLVMAVVQSSSAVTVAAIGCVNAGLLTLGGALRVLSGASVRTTITRWVVALARLELSIELLALPMIRTGAQLRLAGRDRSFRASSQALFRFSLLVLGISRMQSSSASMTVALNALQQGLLTPISAAAVAIGANIGATFIAMLTAISATPGAQRAADVARVLTQTSWRFGLRQRNPNGCQPAPMACSVCP